MTYEEIKHAVECLRNLEEIHSLDCSLGELILLPGLIEIHGKNLWLFDRKYELPEKQLTVKSYLTWT